MKVRRFLHTMLIGSAFALPLFLPSEPISISSEAPYPITETSRPGEDRMQRMITSGECWNGGEGHPLPSRVWLRVDTRNDGAIYRLRGQRLVADAFDQLFNGIDKELDIAAFCE